MTRDLLLTLFGDKSNLAVFEAIAKARTVRLKELEESLGLPREDILSALAELEAAELVKSVKAPKQAEDFRTSYPTAEGLAVERELHRLELA